MQRKSETSREHAGVEILTPQQAGELLNVRPRQLQRMGVPVLDWGHKTKRYVKHDVLAWLDEERKKAPRRSKPQ